MMDSNNESNTYDKSTLDAKFLAINDKLVELNKSLSSCVTKIEHNKDIATAITNALGELPKHYVTYEELLVYLNHYITEEDVDKILSVNENPIIVSDGDSLKLKVVDNKINLISESPEAPTVVTATITPNVIEYGQDNPTSVRITVNVNKPNNIKKILITGGSLVNKDITTSKTITDNLNNTSPVTYAIYYTTTDNITKVVTVSTSINRRVLYGTAEPNSSVFESVENMKNYSGSYILSGHNPSSITINQKNREYGYIATPWKIDSFSDKSIGYKGGWLIEEIATYDSPYSDKLKYYVYRTVESGLGNVTWNITTK